MSVSSGCRPQDPARPLVSVVVVTYNSRPHLTDLLASLRAQTLQDFELLVLDSASTDDTIAALRSRWNSTKSMPRFRMIASPENLGYREGNRIAIQLARGEFVLVLNDDVELHPRLLEELVACMGRHPDTAMAAPAILVHGSPSRLNAAGSDLLPSGFYAARAKDELLADHQQPRDIAAVSGCAFLVRREALDDQAAFDSIYGDLPSGWHASAEDLDLCWRLLARGGRIRYQPRAIIWHKYRQKPLSPQRFASLVGGRLLFVWLNFPRNLLLRVSPLLLATECALVFYAVWQGMRTRSAGHLRAWGQMWLWLWHRRGQLAELRAQRQKATTRTTPQLAAFFATRLSLNPALRRGTWPRAGADLWLLVNRCFRTIACLGTSDTSRGTQEPHAWQPLGESAYMRSLAYRGVKRIVDFVAAALLLVLLSPVLAFVALLVSVGLGSPVLFRQSRIGLDERPFTLLKFRTMRDDRDANGELLSDAERLPPFGAWLRTWSLDELPQLWNVLCGDMSFIGPRPLLPDYLPRYAAEHRIRHAAPPGLSGLAQVNGRNATSWQRRLDLDVQYVRQANLWLDFRLCLQTAGTLLSRRGISQPGSATMPEFRGLSQDA